MNEHSNSPYVIARSNACCDVAIKAKLHFATLDSHAIARNDIWNIQIFRNPNEVWISSRKLHDFITK